MTYEVINEKLKVEACRNGDLTMDQRKLIEVLDMLKYSYIGEVPCEIIQSIFQKYDSGLIDLCQVFIYGVIEGKRAERARRAQHHD